MSSYATQADFEAYVEGWVTDDPAALARLLERASEDVDRRVRFGARDADGRIFGDIADGGENPRNLSDYQRRQLTRATCAQAEYRFEVGEHFFTRPAAESISGPEFTVKHATGGPPRFSSKALEELHAAGLVATSARATT